MIIYSNQNDNQLTAAADDDDDDDDDAANMDEEEISPLLCNPRPAVGCLNLSSPSLLVVIRSIQ